LAIVACTRLQACALVANAAISIVGLGVTLPLIANHPTFYLALLGNATACAAISVLLLLGTKSVRIARWLARRFPALEAPVRGRALGSTAAATLLCVAGRLFQTAQYAALLAAVECTVTIRHAFLAQDIQLIGAAAGDFVPNQMGATESAFFLFGKSFGLTDDLSRMVAIALLVRLVQTALAAGCLLLVGVAGDANDNQ
jgi:hypothetical protein